MLEFSRRSFIAALGAMSVSSCTKSVSYKPQLAVTMDDFNSGPQIKMSFTECNNRILAALAKHNHKAAGFVTGGNVDTPQGRAAIQAWNDQGHMLGNHTWSHMNSSNESPDIITADMARNDIFMEQFSAYEKIMRFPFLAEGKTPEKIAYYRAFMDREGWQNAAVTLDTFDWFTTSRLSKRLKQNPDADLAPYRDYYVKSVLDMAAYYQGLAERIGQPKIPHAMLMHHNVLNGLFLDDVLTALKDAGWELVDAKTVFAHPLYHLKPKTPVAGRSLLSALAQGQGITDRAFPEMYKGFGKQAMTELGL